MFFARTTHQIWYKFDSIDSEYSRFRNGAGRGLYVWIGRGSGREGVPVAGSAKEMPLVGQVRDTNRAHRKEGYLRAARDIEKQYHRSEHKLQEGDGSSWRVFRRGGA
jgi:hypothetical protein